VHSGLVVNDVVDGHVIRIINIYVCNLVADSMQLQTACFVDELINI